MDTLNQATIMQKDKAQKISKTVRKLALGLASLCLVLTANQGHSQCDFQEDFSSPTAWKQVGQLVEIRNGRIEFINGAPDRAQRRVQKSLGTVLNENDIWTAEFDFWPQAVGTRSGKPFTGHTLLALTAGTNDPFTDCPNLACTTRPLGTQDGVICQYVTTNPPDGNIYFQIKVKDSITEYSSAFIKANSLMTMYYLKLERTADTQIVLGAFTDSARQQHLPGSPVSLTIPKSVKGLHTVQAGSVVRGWYTRELTGWVDNFCIRYCQKALQPISMADTTICPGDSARLRINITNGYHVTWSPSGYLDPDSGATIAAFPPTTQRYTATVSGKLGCEDTTSILVKVQAPNAKAGSSGDTLVCKGDTAWLQGFGGVYYSWTPQVQKLTGNWSHVYVLPSVSGRYYVTIADSIGCKDTASVLVRIKLAMDSFRLSNDTIICTGDTARLYATGGLRYEWSPSAYLNKTFGRRVLAFPDKKQRFRVRAFDSIGCNDTASLVVHLAKPFLKTGGDTIICDGDSAFIRGFGGRHYQWELSKYLSSPNSAGTYVFPVENQRFNLTSTNDLGCTDTASVFVVISRLSDHFKTSSDTVICLGDTVQLHASGAAQYHWSPAQFLTTDAGSTVGAFPTRSLRFHVRAISSIGCVDTASIWLRLQRVNAVVNPVRSVICYGEKVGLEAQGGAFYKWSPSDYLNFNNTSKVQAFPSNSQRFVVRVSDSFGCHDTASTFVRVIPNAMADFVMPDSPVSYHNTYALKNLSRLAREYEWYYNGELFSTLEHPDIQFDENGRISVMLVAFGQYGCNDTLIKYLNFHLLPPLLIPNVFSPNGDGFNDRFVIQGIYSGSRLTIFNRWGSEVYNSRFYGNDWNGTTEKDAELAPGVYYYVFESGYDQSKHLGTITIVR